MHQITLKVIEADKRGVFKFSFDDYFDEKFYADAEHCVVVKYRPVTKIHEPFSAKRIFGRE